MKKAPLATAGPFLVVTNRERRHLLRWRADKAGRFLLQARHSPPGPGAPGGADGLGPALGSGTLQHARPVPFSLRPDQPQRIIAKPQRVGGCRQIDHHLRVALSAEAEGPLRPHGLRAEARPERLQPLPRMPIGPREPLAAGDVQRFPHDPEGDGRPAILRPDRQALQLHEITEESQPQAGRRFAANPTQQVHAAEIIPIEFFLVWAILPGHVDDGPNGDGPLEVIHRADNADFFRGRGGGARDHGSACG
jgi:hypothetical protein